MVNVASRIPFNLHNQVIPKEESGSRSASRSIDDQYDSRYYNNTYSDYHYSNYDYRQRVNIFARGNGSRSASPSPRAGPSNGDQQEEDVTEQPKPTPILNIRLVGYDDTQFRGRTRARGPVPSGLPSFLQPKPQVDDAATPVANTFPNIEVTTPTQQQPVCPAFLFVVAEKRSLIYHIYKIPVFKLQDSPPMTISWWLNTSTMALHSPYLHPWSSLCPIIHLICVP